MEKGDMKATKTWRYLCIVLTVVGVSLCMSGLFTPDWYEVRYVTGIVVTRVSMGLWVDNVCVGLEPCTYKWMVDAAYHRHPEAQMPVYYTLVGFQGGAITFGLAACAVLSAVIAYPRARHSFRWWGNFFHAAPLIIGGIMSMTCPILLYVYGETASLRWGPLLPLIGGAVMIFTGFMATVAMRPGDPSEYRQFENPQTQTKQDYLKFENPQTQTKQILHL